MNMKVKIILYALLPLLLSACTSFIPRNKLDNYNNRIKDNLTIYIYTYDQGYYTDNNDDNLKWIAFFKENLQNKFSALSINTVITTLPTGTSFDSHTENSNNLILSIQQESVENYTNSNYSAFDLIVTLTDKNINKDVWKAKIRSGIKKGSLSYAASTSGYLIKALQKDKLL